MAERTDNRIEVDLRLLQDKEMDRLTSITALFSTSVATFSASMETYADQLAGHAQSVTSMGRRGRGRNRAGFGQPDTTAHAMPRYDEAIIAKRNAVSASLREQTIVMQTLAEQNERRTTRNEERTMPQRPGPPDRSSRNSPSFDLDGNGQQGLGDFMIGSGLLTNPKQALGLMGFAQIAQFAQKNVSARTSDVATRMPTNYAFRDDLKIIGGRSVPDGLGRAMSGPKGQWFSKNAVPIAAAAGFAMQSFGNRTVGGSLADAQQLGYDVGGDSTGGWQTLGLMNLTTEGGRHALQQKWSDKLATAAFNWSGDQQAELRSELTRRGLTYDPSGAIKDAAKQGIPIGVSAEFMDTYRRVDPDALKTLGSDLELLRSGAKAAGMSVEQFAQGVAQATQQITQSTGVGTRQAAGYVTAAGLGGLRPDQAASFANRDLTLRTLARQHARGNTNLTYYDVMSNPALNQAEARQTAATMFPAMKDPQHFEWIKKNANKDPRANREYKQMMSQLQLYGSDPWVQQNILMGMTPEEFMSTTGTEQLRGSQYGSEIQEALKPGQIGNFGKSRMREMLKGVGYKGEKIEEFFKDTEDKSYGDQLRKLQSMVGKKSGRSGTDKKVELDLTDRAAKLLKIKSPSDVVRRAADFGDMLPNYGATGALSNSLKLGGAIMDLG